jgi:hypothetical protein
MSRNPTRDCYYRTLKVELSLMFWKVFRWWIGQGQAGPLKRILYFLNISRSSLSRSASLIIVLSWWVNVDFHRIFELKSLIVFNVNSWLSIRLKKGAVAYLYTLDSAAPQIPEARVVTSGEEDVSTYQQHQSICSCVCVCLYLTSGGARARGPRPGEPPRYLTSLKLGIKRVYAPVFY